MPLIERQRDAAVSTVAAVLSTAAAGWSWYEYGFTALGGVGALLAIFGGVWTLVYLARGEGQDGE